MAVQFTRRDPGRDSLADDAFQPPPPQRIPDRHGARVLNPSTAVVAAGPGAPPTATDRQVMVDRAAAWKTIV
ncbi:MAG TPA: hypothetical protein VF892_09165 [Pseudonocardiaceae bacterium]